ncbi:MAG: hypothetical protein LUD29_04510 [Clostridia bacterium]|nr:hypothetical protein [Clostridia bacterium]
MKRPIPSDFGLTEENLNEVERQLMDYRDACETERRELQRKRQRRRARAGLVFVYIGLAFVLIALVLQITYTSCDTPSSFGWFFSSYTIGFVCFVVGFVFIFIRVESKTIKTDKAVYVDQKLEVPYERYKGALSSYEKNSVSVFKGVWTKLGRPSAVDALGQMFEAENFSVTSLGDGVADIFIVKDKILTAVKYQNNPLAAHSVDVENFIIAMRNRGGISNLLYVCPVDIETPIPDDGHFAKERGMGIEIWIIDDVYGHALKSGFYDEEKEELRIRPASIPDKAPEASVSEGDPGEVTLE